MNQPVNLRPTYFERLKIAFHYVLPQLAITRLAGWVAKQEWGVVTHAIIQVFMRVFKIDLNEAQKTEVSDYKSFNEFFIRPLKDGARPIFSGEHSLCLPADGKISECGVIEDNRLLQAKGHFFTVNALLAGDETLANTFQNGTFLTTYLSPRDYHRVHMPCDGLLRQMIYVPGELFSVSPFLAKHIPNLFARNERIICVFDTLFGPMIQILVGATITASMRTVWHGVVNPPRFDGIKKWDYPSEGDNTIRLQKGEEMGAFQLGSTVINLFTVETITLNEALQSGLSVKMGEELGIFRQPENQSS